MRKPQKPMSTEFDPALLYVCNSYIIRLQNYVGKARHIFNGGGFNCLSLAAAYGAGCHQSHGLFIALQT